MIRCKSRKLNFASKIYQPWKPSVLAKSWVFLCLSQMLWWLPWMYGSHVWKMYDLEVMLQSQGLWPGSGSNTPDSWYLSSASGARGRNSPPTSRGAVAGTLPACTSHMVALVFKEAMDAWKHRAVTVLIFSSISWLLLYDRNSTCLVTF